MKRTKIDVNNFSTEIFNLWDKKWMLLTSGDFDKKEFNTMTVAWGSIGIMWSKPFVQVVVRPTRYTYEYMEKYDTFTLTAFPDEFKKKLGYLGSVSGKDENKIEKAGLTPSKSISVSAPGFKEAELIIECKKNYWSDMQMPNMIDKSVLKLYDYDEKTNDFHRIYFGEIQTIQGSSKYTIN